MPSIFDSILSEGEVDQAIEQDQVIDFSQSIEEDDLHSQDLLFEDDDEPYDDENFCNELLDQVQIADEEEEVIYYETPSLELLNEPKREDFIDEEWIFSKMDILERTFLDFGVKVRNPQSR